MSSTTLAGHRPRTRDESATLFSRTMRFVAATAVVFALGAYLARHVSTGWSWVSFVGVGRSDGLFVAGFGAASYATKRDLTKLARGLTWALVALILFLSFGSGRDE